MMVVKKMIKTIRVMLIPNNKQNTKLFRYANTARFAYNWALGREKENYKNGGKFLSDSDLRKEFTQLKKTEEYSWLNEVSNNVTKQAIKDLAICSDGNKYKNINKTKKVKKLEKQKRRLQRSISRSYENNKQGKEYCKTKNVIKKEKLLLTLNHRLTNIRHDHLHHITSEIVKREPSFICIEDLNVKGMMKNRHLSKAVQQQGFYEFRRQMEYKSKWNNIQVIIADRFFPSSKLCSCCGKIKKDLKLSERIYKCECGNVVDRDLQAALNLKKYGEDVLKRSVA